MNAYFDFKLLRKHEVHVGDVESDFLFQKDDLKDTYLAMLTKRL